jgi:hypothetical protein
MAKHEDNAVIFLLCIVIGIVFVAMVFLLMQLMTVDARLRQNKREVDKAIIMLREERQKFKEAKKGLSNE